MKNARTYNLFNKKILLDAIRDSFKKLSPVKIIRNPVVFIVAIGALITTLEMFFELSQRSFSFFNAQIAVWLWFTVLFANFSEAIAEGRGKAQAENLRRSRVKTTARKIAGKKEEVILATDLKKGDLVVCRAGDIIPSDGEVIEGVASVDESAITGESAPVIRESGGDRSAVTGGTSLNFAKWQRYN